MAKVPCGIIYDGTRYTPEQFMAKLMDGSIAVDIAPASKQTEGEFTTVTEKTVMPDGEEGVRVTLKKPDGEIVQLGVMYPEDVDSEVAKKIRGYKLQQSKPEAVTESQIKQSDADLTGRDVMFEHAGADVTGVVVGIDDKGDLKVKDAKGTNYTVKRDKANPIDEITAAKNEFAEALKEFKDVADITKLGVKGTDPQAQAEAMYKIHKALVRMAKAYIAKGINDVKKFASAVGITAKQAQQAWEEALGNAKYAAEDLAYDIADLTKTAIRRGIKVREKFAEYKRQQKDVKKSIDDFINDAEIRKAISPSQLRALVSRAAKVTTEAQLDRFIDYAQKVIDNVNYSAEMDEIRDMQQSARKRNHVSFGNIVREFTSINPEKIPDNLLVAYKTALDGLMARVPSYKAMEEIFYEIAQANFKPDTFSNIQTYQQAQELYNKIAISKIGSIEEYRDLFKSINGFKRRVEQLFENGDITEDQRNDLIDQVGKDQATVESKYASEITSLKTDLINEIRSKQKSTGISQVTTEEKKLLEEFYKLDNNDLRSLSPEELYNLSSILDNVMDEGRVDVFRLSPLVNRAKAASEATQLQEQLSKAKPFQDIKKSVEEVVKKMGMTYSSFWENTLGLGAVNYGAFQKYVVAPMERAIGSYRRDVQEGYKTFNDLKKKYGVNTEKQMNKIGMIATYLREYGMSNDPKYKGKKDGKGNQFGTRDWFAFVLTDPETRARMKTEEIDELQKLYDQLPKVNGRVSPEEVYNGFMANDGRFLSANEMNFLKEVMDWRDKNMTGKQKYANELRGKPFEDVMFHIKRIRKGDTKLQAATPVEVSERTGNVRIAAGSGKEVTNNELGAVETNFEKLFAETLEENARDYYITPMLQKQNDVMNKAKSGLSEDKKSYIEVMKKNLASAINSEFEDGEANRLVTNLLKARAAQVLIAPIRTVGEATAALVSYPLRSGNFSAYGELFKKRDAVSKLMKQSNSPFQNRVDLSRQFDVQKGNIKGEGWLQKASELFAALPERMGVEPVWMAVFNNAFEKETGVKFDRESYLNNPQYGDKYNKVIEVAGAVADATYGQIAGSTTRAGSRRDIKILPESVTSTKLAKMLGVPESVQSKKTMGTLAAFMTGYPFREIEQVLKSGSALKEAIKDANYSKGDVVKTLMPPVGVALSSITYNYWQALSYQFSKMILGDEEEKEKAKKDIENLFTGRTAILETAATMLSTLGTRYSGFSRTAVSWLGSLYYNLAEDEKDKQVAKDFVRNITYQDPFVLQRTKSGGVNNYMLKEKLAWQTAQAVPAFGIVVDNAAKAVESIGGIDYLKDKIEKGATLTEPEKEALILTYVAVNMGNGVAELFGYGLPATTINKMARKVLEEQSGKSKSKYTAAPR